MEDYYQRKQGGDLPNATHPSGHNDVKPIRNQQQRKPQTNHANGSNVTNPPNSSPTNNENNDDGTENENPDKTGRNRRRNRNKDTVVVSTGDPEKDKQIRTRVRIIQQKLRDINKLKAKRDNGDGVDANQLSKINTEADLVKELHALKVSA